MINEFEEILRDYDVNITLSKIEDYDISILLFKEIKKGNKPEYLVKDILEKIKKKFGENIIEKYEFINGYLNIKLNLMKLLEYFYKNNLFEFSKKNKNVIIEHTSVNPNKALHIGHLRNTILGDSLYRLMKTLGYNVIRMNYIDDTGSQVADVIFGFYFLKLPINPSDYNIDVAIENIVNFLKKENLYREGIEKEIRNILEERMFMLKKLYGYEVPKKFDHYCGDFVYYVVNKLYDILPDTEKYKKIIISGIEKEEGEIWDLANYVVDKVLEEQMKTLENFDIYHDVYIRESDILKYNLWNITFEILKNKKIIEYVNEGEKKGCWIINLDRWEEFKNYEDKQKVVVRSDGTTVYLSKDIAFALWKVKILDDYFTYRLYKVYRNGEKLYITGGDMKIDFRGDISINVIGSEQSYLQLIIKKIIEEIDKNKAYIHYGYGLVMLSKEFGELFNLHDKEIIRMSGRKGVYINADNLLDIVYKEVKKTTNLDDEICKKIAVSTINFEILKYDRNSTIVFDLKKMTNIEEGNALYLLYTYARINSLLKKYGKEVNPIFDSYNLNKYERNLLLKILYYRDVLLDAEKNLDINNIAQYTVQLARIFNEFYQNVPVLSEIDKYPYRIFLVYLTKIIMDKLFYILKIQPVDRI